MALQLLTEETKAARVAKLEKEFDVATKAVERFDAQQERARKAYETFTDEEKARRQERLNTVSALLAHVRNAPTVESLGELDPTDVETYDENDDESEPDAPADPWASVRKDAVNA